MKIKDQELISRAQSGDTPAFEELVHRYDRRVLTLAVSFTGNEDEAKDIYQEVFLRVYRSLKGFQFRSEFSTWLHRIVTNVCLTHQMRGRKHVHASLDDITSGELQSQERDSHMSVRPVSPERYAQDAEISQHIQDALETLSPQQRLVFVLKHYQGFKIREIAASLECSDGTVKKYLFTAMEKMRKRLKRIY